LLGLLNSNLLSYLFRIRFQAKHLANGYLAVNKSQLGQLPIRLVDGDDPAVRSLHDKIVAGVDKITALHAELAVAAEPTGVHDLQARIEQCDAEIDDYVYLLYRVTDEERETAQAIPA